MGWRWLVVGPVLALASAPLLAGAATLERIELIRQGPAVRLRFSTPVTPTAKALPGDGTVPERIVVDFAGTTLGRSAARLVPAADAGPLLRVRTGQFTADTARVVLDLATPTPFTVRQRGAVVTIEAATAEPARVETPATPAPDAPPPPERSAAPAPDASAGMRPPPAAPAPAPPTPRDPPPSPVALPAQAAAPVAVAPAAPRAVATPAPRAIGVVARQEAGPPAAQTRTPTRTGDRVATVPTATATTPPPMARRPTDTPVTPPLLRPEATTATATAPPRPPAVLATLTPATPPPLRADATRTVVSPAAPAIAAAHTVTPSGPRLDVVAATITRSASPRLRHAATRTAVSERAPDAVVTAAARRSRGGRAPSPDGAAACGDGSRALLAALAPPPAWPGFAAGEPPGVAGDDRAVPEPTAPIVVALAPPPADVATPVAPPPAPDVAPAPVVASPPRALAGTDLPRTARAMVVIDAGHGGRDPGAAGADGVHEKDVVLVIAQRLAEKLARRLPVTAVLTRWDDSFVPLDERLPSPGGPPTLFVSLHANASADPRPSGFEVFYGGDLLQASGSDGDSPRARRLARLVTQTLRAEIGPVRGAPRRGRFAVLRHNPAPAVLLELGYLTHRDDAARLRDPAYIDRLTDALVLALARTLSADA